MQKIIIPSTNRPLWTAAVSSYVLALVQSDPENAFLADIARRADREMTGNATTDELEQALRFLEDQKFLNADCVKTLPGTRNVVTLYKITPMGAFILALSNWARPAGTPSLIAAE